MVLALAREGAGTVATIERRKGEVLVSALRIRDDGRGRVTLVETGTGGKVQEISAVPAADGSVEVTVTKPSGVTRARFAATAVQAEMARWAWVVPGSRLAARGSSAGVLPSGAARFPAHGG